MLMSESDQRGFITHLSSRNKRHDTRNVDFFKALLNGKEHRIKEEIGANAYNVLKKRVNDRLLDYLAGVVLHSEISDETNIIKQIILARKLISYNQFKLSFKLLKKAEDQAVAISHYSLLNEIYHTLIQISYHELSEDQSILIQKLEQNNATFLEQEKLNMVYAIVRKAFNDIEYRGDRVDLDALLREQYSKLGISTNSGFSFQSLYQIAMLADIAGAHSRNYYAVDLFFVNKIKDLEGGEGDSEKMLIYHIDLLYIVANIYFRKREFDKCSAYLAKMYKQMERFNEKYMLERLVKYKTLMALNLNFTGDYEAAMDQLDDLFKNKKFDEDALLAPRLVLVMIYVQQGDINGANKLLSKFYRSDSYYERQAGVEWILNKRFIEIIVHIELGNVDLAESRIKSLLRKYKDHLESSENEQVLPFLKLIKVYFDEPDIVATEEFRNKVEGSIPWKENEEEDLLLMSFYAWLKSKMTRQPLYQTTLELVNA